jgi:DNA end-binding protein Ku
MADEPAAPRGLWSGTITFGLVSVPVNLFPAQRAGGVSLRMLAPDGTPLSRRYYCPREEAPAPPEHILRGYEIEPDKHVTVTDEELEALEPRKSRDIDLRLFVKAAEINPLYFERAYFLTPAGDTNKAYRLLAETMQRSGRAAIGTFVMRDTEYLTAILAERGILRAEILRFQDEVRTPADVGLPEKPAVDAQRVRHFTSQIDKLTGSFEPGELRDEHAERLRALAEKKRRQSKAVVATPAPAKAPPQEPDLVEVIRRSLRGAA